MAQTAALKITDIHAGHHIITHNLNDAMPTIREWYADAPKENREEIDDLLQDLENGDLDAEALDHALGLQIEAIPLEDLEQDLQDFQGGYDEAQRQAEYALAARNHAVTIYHEAGLSVTRIAKALGVTRPIVYKILDRKK